MSDPFAPLRRSRSSAVPDLDAIKARAIRIERRRHIALGTGGGIIAVIGLVVLFAGSLPNISSAPPRPLAQSTSLVPTPEILSKTAEPTAPGEADTAERRLAQPESAAFASGGAMKSSEPQPEAAAAPASSDSSTGAGEGRAPTKALEVTLDVQDRTLRPQRGVGFTLDACNRTSEPIEKTFNSGQRYDFEVTRDGEFVWRWSDGKAFTEVIGEERWEPGECKRYNEWWDGVDSNGEYAPYGQYQAVGVLTSSPPIGTERQDFCLDSC
jgi:hypothetical protein